MTKDELTHTFQQLGRGFNVAADLAEHFMPDAPDPEVPAPAPAPAAPTVEVPFPSAEHIDALKAGDSAEGKAA